MDPVPLLIAALMASCAAIWLWLTVCGLRRSVWPAFACGAAIATVVTSPVVAMVAFLVACALAAGVALDCWARARWDSM
jgi:hypothetical protein